MSLNLNLNLNLSFNYTLGVGSEFKSFIVRIPSPRGRIAFMVEGCITKNLSEKFTYIKRMNLTVDRWSTVMANTKIGVGKVFPKTLCYVAFGYGVKQSLAQGSIVQNPIGRIVPVVSKKKSLRSPVQVGIIAADDDLRLALLLFNNRGRFPKSILKCKSDLRKPALYKDILNLNKSPGCDKVRRVFELYTQMI